jgi:hypothetical protein
LYPEHVIGQDELSHTRVVANVWAGSSRSTVTCAFATGDTFAAEWSTTTPDPYALQRQVGLSEDLKTQASWHIWVCPLPTTLAPGTHTLTVTTQDAFGQTFQQGLQFEVWPAR